MVIKTIYLIRAVSPSGDVCYKIGYTARNPKKRLLELQTGNPFQLELLCTYQSKHGTLLETVLHRTYNNVRLEWFTMSDEEVSLFIDTCMRTEANLDQLRTNSYWNKEVRYDDDW